jgi:hypothetical protein
VADAHLALSQAQAAYARATGRASSILHLMDLRVELRMEEAAQAAHHANEPVGEFEVWSTDWQYDDRGQDYRLSITYLPRHFCYELNRDGAGDNLQGHFDTLEDAQAHADAILLPVVPEQVLPAHSRDKSNEAGEVFIRFQGERVKIKTLVEQVLTEANHGCGQHYEIFSRNAKRALAKLLNSFEGPFETEADRNTLAKYLAHDRY